MLRPIVGSLLLFAALAGAQNAERLKAVILTGESDTPSHFWRVSTPILQKQLEQSGRFEVKLIEEVTGISAETLRPFDVIVLNYNGPRWGERTEAAIEDFVRSGKGLISFHAATYGPLYGMKLDSTGGRLHWTVVDKGWVAYPALIGATWDTEKIGHGARHAFPVKWVDHDHPISNGLPPTFLANDELYHRLTLLPGSTVLATAFSDAKTGGTGNDEPIVWTVAFGKGRTVHMTLGHDASAMAQPGFGLVMARGAEWAATGRVTVPATLAAAEPKDRIRVQVVTGGHAYPVSFYTLFEDQDDLAWSHATNVGQAFPKDLADRFDVVVLHDMVDDLDADSKEHLRAFVEAGKGVVSIHHSIASYSAWPWWGQEVIGGKYFTKDTPDHARSAYKEGVEMIATVTRAGAGHPVTRGVGPLVMADDEAYRGMWHSPEIRVLMETDNSLNDRPVVYLSPNPKYRVVYIQPGHSDSTIRHPAYRRLVRNAIVWASGHGR